MWDRTILPRTAPCGQHAWPQQGICSCQSQTGRQMHGQRSVKGFIWGGACLTGACDQRVWGCGLALATTDRSWSHPPPHPTPTPTPNHTCDPRIPSIIQPNPEPPEPDTSHRHYISSENLREAAPNTWPSTSTDVFVTARRHIRHVHRSTWQSRMNASEELMVEWTDSSQLPKGAVRAALWLAGSEAVTVAAVGYHSSTPADRWMLQ